MDSRQRAELHWRRSASENKQKEQRGGLPRVVSRRVNTRTNLVKIKLVNTKLVAQYGLAAARRVALATKRV